MKKSISKTITAPRGGYRRTIESGRNREFTQVETDRVGRNPFDLSHNFAFTGNIGQMMPTLCKLAYPNEDWTIGADMLVRLQALVAPAMHRIDVRTDFYAVPLRLIWPNFEKFARNDSSGAGLPAWPYVTLSTGVSADVKRFMDYIGIPTTGTPGNTEDVSAMAGAAYNMIYNEWYRPQQIVTTKLDDQLADGNNTANIDDLFLLQRVSFEHDYFTSCLPDPQLGAAPVDIPLGNITLDPAWGAGTLIASPRFTTNTNANLDGNVIMDTGVVSTDPPAGPTEPTAYNPDGTLINQPTTITDLRRAEIVQEWLERTARGGDRYTEVLLMHFNEHTSDERLQRPEFITGVTSPVHISEVLNTTGETLPQGNMAGHGVSVAEGNFGRYHTEEHCIIMGITYIIPKPAYFQGIPREFNVPANPIDGLMWPSFAHIGEQAVLTRELFAYDNNSSDIFGYIPRFSELKYAQNRIGGLFNPLVSGNLAFWTFARLYGSVPTLSADFLEVDNVDFLEPFAVNDDDLILFNIYFKIRAIRCLPVFSTPRL